jgi:hypothetical protein
MVEAPIRTWRVFATLKLAGDCVEVGKEGLHEVEEFFPFWCESEWASLEQGDAEEFFELGDLPADGGLLDAVGGYCEPLP